jgi:predicted nuclease of restriction endonuclease-like (RecB) superfamily
LFLVSLLVTFDKIIIKQQVIKLSFIFRKSKFFMTSIKFNKEYELWFKKIKTAIQRAQIKASLKVNSELIKMYWELGCRIDEKYTNSNWGDGLFSKLSRDLKRNFKSSKGFSETNLKYIFRWYRFYNTPGAISQQLVDQISSNFKNQIENKVSDSKNTNKNQKYITTAIGQQVVDQFEKNSVGLKHRKKTRLQKDISGQNANGVIGQQLVDQLMENVLCRVPWGHHIRIITGVKNMQQAIFYLFKTLENNWSRDILILQINNRLFQRQGKAITNFHFTLPENEASIARQTFKSPYIFEFLNISEKVSELKFERHLVQYIEQTLLELGGGFALVGRQYKIMLDGDEHNIDLLFYHIPMHRYVVLEIKAGEFKPADEGQLNFYVSLVDEAMKKDGDNATIGFIICSRAKRMRAELSLRGSNKPIGISEFKLELRKNKKQREYVTEGQLKKILSEPAGNYFASTSVISTNAA